MCNYVLYRICILRVFTKLPRVTVTKVRNSGLLPRAATKSSGQRIENIVKVVFFGGFLVCFVKTRMQKKLKSKPGKDEI